MDGGAEVDSSRRPLRHYTDGPLLNRKWAQPFMAPSRVESESLSLDVCGQLGTGRRAFDGTGEYMAGWAGEPGFLSLHRVRLREAVAVPSCSRLYVPRLGDFVVVPVVAR